MLKHVKCQFPKFLLVSVFILVFLSCGNNRFTNGKYKVISDTISIDFGEEFSIDYFTYDVFSGNHDSYLTTYNHILHAFDVFSLQRKRFIKRISLEKEGPNGISHVSSYNMISMDSIILINQFGVYIINGQGKVLFNKKINNTSLEESSAQFEEYRYQSSHNDFGCFFNEKEKSILLYRTPRKFVQEHLQFYEEPFIVKLFLEKDSTALIQLVFPEFLRVEGNRYPHKWYPLLSIDYNTLFIGFRGSSELYRYDLTTKNLDIFDCYSEITENRAKAISKDKVENMDMIKSVEYALETLSFYRPHLSHNGQYIWRVHDLGRPKDSPFKAYLSIFNGDFQKLVEMEIPDADALFIPQNFMVENTLYIPIKSEYASESHLTILRFDLMEVETLDFGNAQ